jgi:Tol biopolymer transport system component
MKRADDRYQSISQLTGHLRDAAGDLVEDASELSGPPRWFVPGKVISTAFRRYFPNITGGTGAPRSFYRWQDSDSDARTVRLTEPLPLGEPTELHIPSRGKFPIWITAGALLVFASIPAVWFWFSRAPVQTRSTEPLRPVRLASWKDAANTIYLGYSSSHNGKMLAYSAAQEGPNEAIRVKQIADGGDVPVTKDNWKNYSPIWSPDDQQIAFVSFRDGSYGVYNTSFLGGEPKLIKPLDDGSISLRHWSNDNSAIYYEFNGNLFRLDLASRDAAQITSFEPTRSIERFFAFSSDESKIAYCDRINGQPDLFVIPAGGGDPKNITNDADVEDHPSWYPDGNRIAYSVRRGEHTQIQIAYLDGRPREEVTRGEGEYQLIDVSADGKHIFYTTWEDRSDIWSVNVDSGQESQVAAEKESEFWPDISPDGRSIVYQTNSAQNPLSSLTESTIVIRSIDDVQQSRHLVGNDPRWLPDSRHVAFLRWQGSEKRNALWTVDSVTGEEKMAIDGGINTPDQAALPYNRFQTSEFSWSPDASAVVCTSRKAGILNVNVIDVERSTFAPITQNTDSSVRFYSPLFSADGKRLAYLSVEKSQGKKEGSISRLLVSEDGNLKEVFSTANGLRLLGWTGSQSIVWGVIDGRLRGGLNDMRLIKKSINGQPEFESVLKDIYPTSVSLSPDGNSVAFTARRDDKDDIFTISIAATGVVKKVTSNNDPRIYLGSLTWSPDGRRIFFDKQERIKSISMF